MKSIAMIELGSKNGKQHFRWWQRLKGAGALIPGEWRVCQSVTVENGILDITPETGGVRQYEPSGDITIRITGSALATPTHP